MSLSSSFNGMAPSNQQTNQQSDLDGDHLELVSYLLCPYAQRAVITLLEKSVPFVRTDIDLADKPKWFLDRSPTGKVPLLVINHRDVLFESTIICEYLDTITQSSMLPNHPLHRAQHQGWIVLGTTLLNSIAKLYSARQEEEFCHAQDEILDALCRIQPEIKLPYFGGEDFAMVDAVYATIFRYFDVFESQLSNQNALTVFNGLSKVTQWRKQVAQRQSVINAVSNDYAEELTKFVKRKSGYLAQLILNQGVAETI